MLCTVLSVSFQVCSHICFSYNTFWTTFYFAKEGIQQLQKIRSFKLLKYKGLGIQISMFDHNFDSNLKIRNSLHLDVWIISKTIMGWGTTANVYMANKQSNNSFQNATQMRVHTNICSIQIKHECVWVFSIKRHRWHFWGQILPCHLSFRALYPHFFTVSHEKCWNVESVLVTFPLTFQQSSTGAEHCVMRQCSSNNWSFSANFHA